MRLEKDKGDGSSPLFLAETEAIQEDCTTQCGPVYLKHLVGLQVRYFRFDCTFDKVASGIGDGTVPDPLQAMSLQTLTEYLA